MEKPGLTGLSAQSPSVTSVLIRGGIRRTGKGMVLLRAQALARQTDGEK